MAIWQFHIYFIPRQSLIDKYGHIPAQLEINKESWSDYIGGGELDKVPEFEDALTISWWINLKLEIDELLPILQQFGELQDWTERTEGLRSFGNTEANDISVCFDYQTKRVEELSCRLDLRKIDKCFVSSFLFLAKRFDCLFMDKQGRLYEPTKENLADKIKLSNAYRFIDNPRHFLENLSLGVVSLE